MATYNLDIGTKTFSGSGSLIQPAILSAINATKNENIPRYSTINSVKLTAYIRETTNKLGNADFYVFFGNDSNDSLYQLYYGNGKIPKNNKSDLEVPLTLTSYASSNTSDAGNLSYSGATRLCFRCQSSLLSRDYKLSAKFSYDFTPPTMTLKTVAGAGGTVTPTATYDVTLANQTKQVTATPNAGYRFVKWVTSNGKTFTDQTISATFSHNDISAHSTTITCTAYFEVDKINNILADTSQSSMVLVDTVEAREVLADTTKSYG